MKSILKDTNNSEKLLNMVSDTLILMDKDGVCVDMAVHNVDLWFMNEERLLGKNLLNLLPPVTYSEFYPEFKKVLLRRTKYVRNYELMTPTSSNASCNPTVTSCFANTGISPNAASANWSWKEETGNYMRYRKPHSSVGGCLTRPPANSVMPDIRASCARRMSKPFHWMHT